MPTPLPEPDGPQGRDSLAATSVKRFDDRRRTESAVLAMISLVGAWWLRSAAESTFWLTTEVATIVVIASGLVVWPRLRGPISCAVLMIFPLIIELVARRFGSPVAFEIIAIAMLGVGSLALALHSRTHRQLSMSVVTSGFLVLFTALISDHSGTLIPALLWMSLCLWHLVANHWERVVACTPDEVHRSSRIRPATVIVGLLLCLAGGWAIHGRASDPKRLSWGIMPSSGGSSWSDPGARSGVGSGDAAIAAKDHAESFGAVESELFLESTESTLYDMFSDSLGQPKLKQKWERRQGMTAEKLIHAHRRTAKTEQGSASFSTARHKPKPKQVLRDARERAVLQWVGPTGIRLAMKRYDTFDGEEWTQQVNWRNEQLSRIPMSDEIWYFDPRQTRQLAQKKIELNHGGVLKVLRLDSTRIPSPMMTAGVYIKDIDRPDFFGIERDGSFFMPGREKIPPLTVLHIAATSVLEDDLIEPKAFASRRANAFLLNVNPQRNDAAEQSPAEPSAGQTAAARLATKLTEGDETAFRKLQSIVDYLRTDFSFDREAEAVGPDPLNQFLTSKRGGDHLFATAAAVMCREVGLNSRLVSGFYVRSNAFEIGQGHASIVPEDVHVWVEVQLNDGRWIELEPTPGYRRPDYRASHWLVAKRLAAQFWPHVLGVIVSLTLIYLTRVIWFEILARIAWVLCRPFKDRHRIRVLLWILQRRANFAGKPRRAGLPQRDWLLSLTSRDEKLARGALACCNAADQLVFGDRLADDWSAPANLLVRKMTTRYISRGSVAESSKIGAES